jgi:predicted TIM-barrel fold metal-dependent hydrolase
MLHDAHCHFFSSGFLELLTRSLPDLPDIGRSRVIAARLGWTDPEDVPALTATWVGELDRHGVGRAALIASVPGDEGSVAEAVRLHPDRFVGFFMFDPTAPDAASRLAVAFGEQGLRCACLFPAMHGYRVDDERVVDVFETAARYEAAVFVHCGVLTVGVRGKLGLPSAFDLRLGDPLAVAAIAVRYPTVPVIIPHFGAGFLRETLIAADACRTIHLDTSSSNGWMKYYPALGLDGVFRQALATVGPERLLFGTDSSFFPRGWQKSIHDAQAAALDAVGASARDRALIMGGNFERLFPPQGRS